VDGSIVTLGTEADAAYTGTGSASLIAIEKYSATNLNNIYAYSASISTNTASTVTNTAATNTALANLTLAPSASATYGIAPSATATAAACKVLKASAGNLYTTSGYISAAGYIMVFNSATAPADGTVTPANLAYAPSAGSWSITFSNAPQYMSAGITVCASSTGPFTKTAFATNNFITGQVQ
jgi:hypothetical protein